jgi:hypothetical protein
VTLDDLAETSEIGDWKCPLQDRLFLRGVSGLADRRERCADGDYGRRGLTIGQPTVAESSAITIRMTVENGEQTLTFIVMPTVPMRLGGVWPSGVDDGPDGEQPRSASSPQCSLNSSRRVQAGLSGGQWRTVTRRLRIVGMTHRPYGHHSLRVPFAQPTSFTQRPPHGRRGVARRSGDCGRTVVESSLSGSKWVS